MASPSSSDHSIPHIAGTKSTNSRLRKRRVNESASPTTPVASQTPKGKKRARVAVKKAPAKRDSTSEDGDKIPATVETCCICRCDIEPDELAGVNGCEHRFCFGCIERWAERENSCPLCKNRFKKIDRINKKKKKGQRNTKTVRQRNQRSEVVPHAALQGLLANIAQGHSSTPTLAHLIFSNTTGFGLNNFTGTGFARSSTHSLALFDDNALSDDEDESTFSPWFRTFPGMQVPFQSVHRASFVAQIPSRSHAANRDDMSAGNRADNPLEIDDDSDDDTVEVVQVLNGSGR